MSLDKSDYVTICRMLKISAYLHADDDFNDERLWETGDFLVKMAESIRDLERNNDPN